MDDHHQGLHSNGASSAATAAFFQHHGFNAYDQDPSFHQNFEYAPDPLSLSRNQVATLNSGWPDVLHQQNTQHGSAQPLQQPYYGNAFDNPQSSIHQSPYSSATGPDTFSPSAYDPALVQNPPLDPSFTNPSTFSTTISPHALQNSISPYSNGTVQSTGFQTPAQPSHVSQDQSDFTMPIGQANGQFLLIDALKLAESTNSKPLHHFLLVGSIAQDVSITKSTIPAYHPRRSRNDIRKLLSTDSRLAAKLAKKPSKKAGATSSKPVAKGPDAGAAGTKLPGSQKKPSSPSSGEENSSDDDSANESSEEDTMPSPLPSVRPSGALEAVKYDTIKSLWHPTNRPASADAIRAGLKGYSDVVQTIRDRWKTDVLAVKQAEESKKVHDLPLLKERVQTQRQMLDTSVKAALEFGHPDILEHLGSWLPLILCLAQFLADRAKDTDYNGSLSQSVLQLLSRCKTLTDGTLEKTNVAKILPRFIKRGDEKTQTLAKKIQDNAAAALKKKKEASKAGGSSASQAKDSKPPSEGSPKATNVVAGMKRQRSNDVNGDAPQKKVASEVRNASTSSVGSTTVPKGSPTSAKKQLATTADPKPAAATTAAKPKAREAVVKPSGFFAGLQSAAKKHGTSNAAVAAAAQAKPASQTTATTEKKGLSSARPTPQPKSTFSWSETMASLNQPKAPKPETKPEEVHPPETEEEKTKRLRKEQRRSLRVTFKPEGSLIDIRYFTHDPDEDIGHDPSMVRDVGDVGSEGRALKRHQDQMDIDEDDDESASTSQEITRDFVTPSLIDFSVIDDEQRSTNFERFGGGKEQPKSPEKAIQEQREANTLMVIYSNSSDIPPTPKEPSDPYTGEKVERVDFGQPPPVVLERVAAREASKKKSNAPPTNPIVPDLAALISKIGAPSLQSNQHVQPQQPTPAPTTELEKIFAQFAAQGQQQQQHQPQMQPQPQIQPQPPSQPPNLQAILANITGQAQIPTQHQPQPQPQPPPFAAPPAGIPDSLQAILASLGQGQPVVPQNPAQMAAAMQHMGNFVFGNNLQPQQPPPPQQQPTPQPQQPAPPPQQQQQAQDPSAASYPFENEERRRWREQGGDPASGADADASNGAGRKQTRSGWHKDKKGNRQPPKFVVQCKYWKEGKCRKGAECTFLHDQ